MKIVEKNLFKDLNFIFTLVKCLSKSSFFSSTFAGKVIGFLFFYVFLFDQSHILLFVFICHLHCQPHVLAMHLTGQTHMWPVNKPYIIC